MKNDWIAFTDENPPKEKEIYYKYDRLYLGIGTWDGEKIMWKNEKAKYLMHEPTHWKLKDESTTPS